MYKNKYQPNIIPALQSVGSKPLQQWTIKTKSGCVRKVLDETVKLSAIEILSNNSSDTSITTPPPEFNSLAINLPILVLIVKNMNKFFSFQISILDDKKTRRTFRIANFQTVTRLSHKWCTMPLALNDGWNLIQIDLNSYSEKAFRSKFIEVVSLQVNANVRIRTIYFCDRIYKDEELKDEFKLFSEKKKKVKYIPSINVKKKRNEIGLKQEVETKNEENTKREDIVAEKENAEKGVTEEEAEEEANEETKEEEEDEEENDAEIVNLSTLKNVEMNMENVLYEEVTYEKYNNDDN